MRLPAATPVVLLAIVLLGCSKPSETGPVPSASSAASMAPAASVAPGGAASAMPSSVAAASASASPSAPAASGSGSVAAAGASDAGVECGKKPLPDCPLQAWMKSNANPPVMANDTAKLATVLDRMVTLAPASGAYPNWVPISKDGAAAARTGDMAAAKASCRGCHDQYKAKYRTEMRARKI